jgi:mono/diheme cytochrome c family protein
MRRLSFAAIAMLAAIATPCTLLVAQSAPATATASDTPSGQDLYVANCSSCHQATGAGLPNMAPALKDNPIVVSGSDLLVQIVLKGPAAVLPANRPKFGSNTMDSFYYKLTDDQIAAILNYVRHNFVKSAKGPDIAVKDVADARAKIDPNTLNSQ